MLRSLFAAVSCCLVLAACGPTDEQLGSDGPVVDGNVQPLSKKKRPAPAPAPDPLAGLPTCSIGVLDSFNLSELQPTLEGSNQYRVPTTNRVDALTTSISALLAGDTASALSWATSAEYTLCRGSGSESALALWKPAAGEGQAQLALRTGTARAAIFEAPHPLHDTGTVDEAKYLFSRLNARALIASGTHRCANVDSSACSGTTTACAGTNEPFRVSDMSHNEDSAYHAAHRVLSDHFAQDWVFAIHGMADDGVSVSDGTTFSTASDAPSAKVANALAARFAGVTVCNDFGGVPYSSRLCGTTDVQGRYLNGSSAACTSASTSSAHRFVHMEQSRLVRDSASLVGDALDSVIP